MPQKPKFKLKEIIFDGNTIGQRIAKTRKRKGLTQTVLAEKIGISQRLVSDYEIGRVRISADMLCRFAIALGVTSDSLLGLNNSKNLEPELSIRFTRRMLEISNLSENKIKSILKTMDDLIRDNS